MGAGLGAGRGQGGGVGAQGGGVDHRLGEGRDVLGRDDEAVAAGADERLGSAAGLRGDEGEAGAGIFGDGHAPAVEAARQDAAVAVVQRLGDALRGADAEAFHARQAVEGRAQRPRADDAQRGLGQARRGLGPSPRQDVHGLAVGEGAREDEAKARMRTRLGGGRRAGGGVGQLGGLVAPHAPAADQVVHRLGTQAEGRDGGAVDVPREEAAQRPGARAALALLGDEAPRDAARLAEAHVVPVDPLGVAGEDDEARGVVRDGGEGLAQGGDAAFLRGEGRGLGPAQRRAVGVVVAEIAHLHVASRGAERVDPGALMEIGEDRPVNQLHAHTIAKKATLAGRLGENGGANRSRTDL